MRHSPAMCICYFAASSLIAGCLSAAEIRISPQDDIASAISSAADGDVLLLAEGEYLLDGELLLDKAVTLRGAGMDRTLLKQTASNNRVIALGCADAVVEDMTLTGGIFTTERGRLEGMGGCGVLIMPQGGTVRRARITGNKTKANQNRGIGIDIRSANGLLADSVVDGNIAEAGGGNGSFAGIYMSAGTVDRCLVIGNVGHNSGGVYIEGGSVTIRNSTIAGNRSKASASNLAAGICIATSAKGCVVENCLISDNEDSQTALGGGFSEWYANQYAEARFENCRFSHGTPVPSFGEGSQSVHVRFLPLSDYRQRLASEARDFGYYAPFDYATAQIDFLPSAVELMIGAEVAFEAFSSGFAQDAVYSWTVAGPGSASVALTGKNPVFRPETAGYYSVELRVEDAQNSLLYAEEKSIKASVSEINASSTEEFFAALDLAINGTTINLGEGLFETSGEIVLGKGITVKGCGMDKTVVRQTAKNKRVFTLSHPNDKLAFLAVTGASIESIEGEHGAGVRINLGGGTLSHVRVTGNRILKNWTYGAGVASFGEAVIEDCIIDHNENRGANGNCGGGLYIEKGSVTGSLISENIGAQYGCGIFVQTGPVTVRQCTIAANELGAYSTAPSGGNLHLRGNAAFVNCLFALGSGIDLKSTALDKEYRYHSGAVSFSYCLWPSHLASLLPAGCIYGDAAFAGAASSDWRPLASSPSVDAGVWYEGMSQTDLDGNGRISGSSVDIGCYEFDSAAFSASFAVSRNKLHVGESVVLEASCSGVEEGEAVSYAWSIRKGAGAPIELGGQSVSFAAPSAGYYSVLLTARKSSGAESSHEIGDAFYAAPAVLYVRPPAAGFAAAAAFPFDGWGNAATNLEDALSCAIDGSVIRLDGGTHLLYKTAFVDKAVEIEGMGYQSTVLSPSFRTASIIKLNHPLAKLSRMTVTGFYADNEVHSRGAVSIEALGGTVEDCRITGNRYYTGRAINQACGIGITIASGHGLVNRCIIDRNEGSVSAVNSRGGGVQGLAGRIENSLICANTNAAGGGIAASGSFVIKNCTIVGNVARGQADNATYGKQGAGGIFINGGSPSVINTVVYGNQSLSAGSFTGYPEWRLAADNLAAPFSSSLLPPSVSAPEGSSSMVFADPMLFGDFVPRPSSPCRNAGDSSCVGQGERDLGGRPRIMGRDVDIGALEALSGPGTRIMMR